MASTEFSLTSSKLTILESIAPKFLLISDPSISNLEAIALVGVLKVGLSLSFSLICYPYLYPLDCIIAFISWILVMNFYLA